MRRRTYAPRGASSLAPACSQVTDSPNPGLGLMFGPGCGGGTGTAVPGRRPGLLGTAGLQSRGDQGTGTAAPSAPQGLYRDGEGRPFYNSSTRHFLPEVALRIRPTCWVLAKERGISGSV